MKTVKLKFKKAIASLLALLMIMCSLPINAFGDDVNVDLSEQGDLSNISIKVDKTYGHEVHYTTVNGVSYPLFCIEYGKTSPSNSMEAGRKEMASAQAVEAAKWVTAGYYMVHGNSLDFKDMAMCQKKVWEVMGSNTSWTFSNSDYANWCATAEANMSSMATVPSFDGNSNVANIIAGQNKTITDSNGVLKDYPAFTKYGNGWRIVHNEGANDLTIYVDKTCTATNFVMLANEYMKKHTGNDEDLVLFYPYGSSNYQKLIYSAYYDPVTMAFAGTITPLGKIEITKNDSYNASVNGAVFGLYSDNACTNRLATATSSNGKVVFDDLVPNTYYVKEISAPTGYLINETVKTYTVTSNNTSTGTVINTEPKGSITITKNLDTSKTNGRYGDVDISTAVYELIAKNDIKSANGSKTFYTAGTVVATSNIVPNADKKTGAITWSNIPLGDYIVKEKTAPNGAFIDTTEYTVSLKYKNQTTNLIVDSSTISTDVVKSMTANIFKEGVKGQSGLVQGLAGAEFTIKLYSDYQTALQQGYKIEEIWATKNSNNEWYGIDINSRKVKVDATRAANANNIAPTYDTVTTDSEGNAVTTYLPYGRYITKETVTPVNFQSGNDFIFSVTKDEGEVDSAYQKVIHLVVNNAPFEAPVKIIKKDIDSDKPVTLSSASYKIRATQDIIDTATGNVIYKQGDFVEVKIGNNKYNEFMTNSDELVAIQDANIYASKGDEKGSVTTPFSLPSGYYELVEVKAPNGFLIDNTPIPFVITNTIDLDQDADGEPVCVVTQSNQQPKGELVINKTFFERADVDKTLIDNIDYTAIKFNVFAKDNIVDMTDGSVVYEEGTLIDTYSLNSDATLNIDNMWVGNYIVKEAETIEGAVLDETEYEVGFSVKDNTTPVYTETLNVVNFTTLVQISKNTITGENELEGATLTVKDSEGNIIDTWVSTDTAHTIEGLIVGKTYTLTEEIAPNGFVKATTIEFTIDNNNNVQKVAMVDKQLLISKVNATTGEELEGAELTITDSEGNVVDSWISTTTPHYASGLIEGETYTLTEITAPYGFKVAESVTFTVSADKETQKVVMKDDYIYSSVRVVKCDIQTKKPIISNAFEFSIYADKECTQLIETSGANKSEGTALFENLIYGTYYIKETKAPLGYSLSDQVVEIVINEGGVFADGVNLAEENDIYSFEYYDELLPVLNTGDTTDISKAITLIVLIAALAGWLVIVKNLFKMKNKEAQEPEQKDGKDE